MQDRNYIHQLAVAIRAQVDPSGLPLHGQDDLFASYAVLVLARGASVTNRDVHNVWAAWATEHDPTNPDIVPYERLASSIQREDTRFTRAIRAVAVAQSRA